MDAKTNWDYFCELMIAIPGLSSMFTDADEREDGTPNMYAEDKHLEWRRSSRRERAGFDVGFRDAGAY